MERGRYLSHAVCECFECHTPLRSDELVEPDPSKLGAGDILNKKERHVAPNITPDPETGAGRWTDEQLIRAIREGIGHDGRRLSLVMPYWKLSILTDDDVRSIVAYLRSLPPIRNRLPHWIPLRDAEPPPEPPRRPATNADLTTVLGRGEYLAHLAGCVHCHTARPLVGTEWERRKDLEFGGGPPVRGQANLRRARGGPGIRLVGRRRMPEPEELRHQSQPHDRSVGHPVLRRDHLHPDDPDRQGRGCASPDPRDALVRVSQADRRGPEGDLRSFSARVPPVRHRVSNTDPPTFCPRLRPVPRPGGLEHPLANRLARRPGCAGTPGRTLPAGSPLSSRPRGCRRERRRPAARARTCASPGGW